jgi:hypothetical protein
MQRKSLLITLVPAALLTGCGQKAAVTPAAHARDFVCAWRLAKWVMRTASLPIYSQTREDKHV